MKARRPNPSNIAPVTKKASDQPLKEKSWRKKNVKQKTPIMIDAAMMEWMILSFAFDIAAIL